ncbi:putative metal chaperone YciC [Oxobacter pfennigii]|uniref:Putative metal chaperone YciC n=1 Tax=Oxobacter pfennigii TaxID=36849 RepID=A0A0P8WL70_9CLOT|nr:GTP-binding protein [Oxobacter pfennigii]KPU43134.1 putative metal chaperone YciC [Oxobacter pfennigii]
MKILIMGGFLGSGKTSVVIQLAKFMAGENPDKPYKVVIIENEIGEVGIDDKILSKIGYKVEGMFSGCVCCTISGELVLNVLDIMKNMNPDYIIMESTGVAYPNNIKEILEESIKDIDCRICCVTDAKRWKRLLKPMELLLKDQLKNADVILINKVDAIDSDTLIEVDESVKTFNNTAQFFHVSAIEPIDSNILTQVLGQVEKGAV